MVAAVEGNGQPKAWAAHSSRREKLNRVKRMWSGKKPVDRASASRRSTKNWYEPYGDSLRYPASIIADIDTTWNRFVIDLQGANLKHIIGGFCWVTNRDENPAGAVFYLDDIRYEP